MPYSDYWLNPRREIARLHGSRVSTERAAHLLREIQDIGQRYSDMVAPGQAKVSYPNAPHAATVPPGTTGNPSDKWITYLDGNAALELGRGKAVDYVVGNAVHEAAHVRWSDPKGRATDDGLVNAVQAVFEDACVNRRLLQHFPGLEPYLGVAYRTGNASLAKRPEFTTNDLADTLNTWAAKELILGQQEWAPRFVGNRRLMQYLDAALVKADAMDGGQREALRRRIAAMLRRHFASQKQKQQEQQEQQKQQEQREQAKQGDGEGQEQQKQQEQRASGGDAKAGQSDTEQNNCSEEETQQESTTGSQRQEEAPLDLQFRSPGESVDPLQKRDVRDALARSQAGEEGLSSLPPVKGSRPLMYLPTEYHVLLIPHPERYRRVVDKIVLRANAPRRMAPESNGKVNGRHLHRAVMDGRAFSRVKRQRLDLALALVLDGSGSISSSTYQDFTDMAEALRLAVERLGGKVIIVGYGSRAVRIYDPWIPGSKPRHLKAHGNTHTCDGLCLAASLLQKINARRKILAHFTDGEPTGCNLHNYPYPKKYVSGSDDPDNVHVRNIAREIQRKGIRLVHYTTLQHIGLPNEHYMGNSAEDLKRGMLKLAAMI